MRVQRKNTKGRGDGEQLLNKDVHNVSLKPKPEGSLSSATFDNGNLNMHAHLYKSPGKRVVNEQLTQWLERLVCMSSQIKITHVEASVSMI